MTDAAPVRILIVEDHPLYLKSLRSLIQAEGDLLLVGDTDNGTTAVTLALDLQPDLILMDLHLPGQSGITATREIVNALPGTRILVITLFEDENSVFAALRAGARGYILKDADEGEIIRAVRSVANGDSLFSPSIANQVLAFFAAARPVAPRVFPALTDRERDILTLLARGKTNAAIAQDLHLSSKTIANNLTNIFSKLQVADRSEAIIRARDAGLHS
jgi:DNA-binding NarL/FixJ family response regulator